MRVLSGPPVTDKDTLDGLCSPISAPDRLFMSLISSSFLQIYYFSRFFVPEVRFIFNAPGLIFDSRWHFVGFNCII